jgi:uncharacterized iron-regulated membrane protein
VYKCAHPGVKTEIPCKTAAGARCRNSHVSRCRVAVDSIGAESEMQTDARPVLGARERGMSPWQQWVERPQVLWVRRAFFQVHLWVGIGIGLYVLLISVSGSAVVYRRELMRKYARRPIVAIQPGGRMSVEELRRRAQAHYPGFTIADAYESRRMNAPATVTLERETKRMERYFNPYTGADLGATQSEIERIVGWFVDLHDNLLLGTTGRLINGIGSILVTMLALTGLFIWWPGIKNWRRSLKIQWNAQFARFTWDLHSALGFWCSLVILMWGISGIYFSFPEPFNAFFGDTTLLWLSRLHFGRFGWLTEGIWTIFGFVPAVLFVTGALMWWNRKLRKSPRAVE